MDNNFVNMYIEQLNNHNADINKQQIILVTQIKFHEKVNAELSEQNKQLIEKIAQLEEQNKLLSTVPKSVKKADKNDF